MRVRSAVLLALAAAILALIAVRLFPRAPLSGRFSSSTAIYDSKSRLLRLTLSDDDKYRLWVPLDRISPALKDAFLLREDRHFRWHFGVNPFSLIRAARETYISRGPRVGGSTITMQLARLIYRINSRSPLGKLRQIARAIEIELLYSKDSILEAYLNLVPFGRNIEGVAAASLIFYGKDADSLTVPEAIALALIPQSPARRKGDGIGDEKLKASRDMLFAELVARHPGAAGDGALMGLPLSTRGISDLPFLAPHFVNMVLARRSVSGEVRTTLDLDLQRLVERHVRAFIARNRRVGIRNASVLLLDHRTMEVAALMGSADFFDASIEGQVNGAAAKRSPGSALKPFVYALAMEQGLVHPMTLLKDSPTTVGSFNPENFDGQFAGPVSAKEALIRSRNVPAVALASRLSDPGFHEFLKIAGVRGLKSEQHYGPSLVIGGGGEVTMEELASLYAMLAAGGVVRPPRYLKSDPIEGGAKVLSEEASFIALDMLGENPRPDERYDGRWIRDRIPVSWKTGTSHGFRDAWTVGVFGPYVLAVWVGNFDGEGNPSFIGIRAASPLFFQIADSMRAHGNALSWPALKAPRGVKRVEVCAVSGGIPGAHCGRRTSTWFIPGRSPIQPCDIHREVAINAATGRQACDSSGAGARREVFEFWPSDLLRIFRQAGIPRRTPPPFEEGCSLTAQAALGRPPKITSPLAGVTYELRARAQREEQISFLATTDADAREVFWFANGRYIGRAESGQPLMWRADPGEYVVRAVDDMGRSDSREMTVAVIE